jgi:glutamate carboxypeptidase
MKRILSVLLFVHAIASTASAQQNATEQKVAKYIREKLPFSLKLLEEIANTNSGTLNVDGIRRNGNILAKEFEKIGFKTEWILLPDSLKRAGHLVATRKGRKGKKLLLIGHLDTVFEPDMPANPYRLLNDSTATGQGVNDMKGGNVMIVSALHALHEYKLLDDVTITVYLMGDEEKAGEPVEVSRADFITRAKQHDIALAFETAVGLNTVATARRGSSSWIETAVGLNTVATARRGSSSWSLKVSGKQAHSSGIFNNNYGAIYEAARIINSFRDRLGNEKYLTFNPAIFAGGTEVEFDSVQLQARIAAKNNIISPHAIVTGDLRFLTAAQKENARMKMRSIVTTGNLPGTSAEISFRDGIPSMEPTAGNNNLLSLLNKISADIGLGVTQAGDPGSRGAGDISYVAQYIDCLDGLGASGTGAHAPGETINLKHYPLLIQRAAVFIYRLTR